MGSPESNSARGQENLPGDKVGLQIIRMIPGVDLAACAAGDCSKAELALATMAVLPVGGAGAASAKLTIGELRGILSAWNPGTFHSLADTIRYHYSRHGTGQGVKAFTDEAIEFFVKNSSRASPHALKSGEMGVKIRTQTHFGIYDQSGRIITYGPR
jgi:hypothetical protein